MEFKQTFRDSDLTGKIDRLLDDAGKRLKEDAPRRDAQAEALLQQAEREYVKQNYDECLRILDTALENYGDSPAAAKAAKMRAKAAVGAQAAVVENEDTPGAAVREYIKKAGMGGSELSAELEALFSEFDNGR